MDPKLSEALERGNKVVFFDITIAGVDAGRLKLELFYDICPRTCENFRQFCVGEFKDEVTDVPMGYKECVFHRVIHNFMIQGGDFMNGDGTGKISIYGEQFDDENFTRNHNEAGLLSMANSGENTNGCQFFITCRECPWLDGKHVVFGKVLDSESMLVVRKIENVSTSGQSGRPQLPIVISECGEL